MSDDAAEAAAEAEKRLRLAQLRDRIDEIDCELFAPHHGLGTAVDAAEKIAQLRARHELLIRERATLQAQLETSPTGAAAGHLVASRVLAELFILPSIPEEHDLERSDDPNENFAREMGWDYD